QYGSLVRVTDVDRFHIVAHQQSVDALDLIVDIGEGTGLGAVPKHRQVLPAKRLAHKGGDHTPVIEPHPGTVGVEDADDAGIQPVVPVVGHGDGLHKAFGLVIDPPGPYGAHVPEIIFTLGMYQRVTVNLRGGSHQDTGLVVLGQAQEVQ